MSTGQSREHLHTLRDAVKNAADSLRNLKLDFSAAAPPSGQDSSLLNQPAGTLPHS